MNTYDTLPEGTKKIPAKFSVSVAQEQLDLMRKLIELSPIGVATYENTVGSGKFGLSRSWLSKAKTEWTKSFDWYVAPLSSAQNLQLDMILIAYEGARMRASSIAFRTTSST